MYTQLLLIILVVAIAILIAYVVYQTAIEFTGGFEWSNLKTIQPLGSGAFGDVYVVEDDSKHYALKREKIPVDWVDTSGTELTFKPEQMGEIEFYKFIDTLPPDSQKHFVRLHNYRIFKCDHVHKLADWQEKMMADSQRFRDNMNLRIQSPYCAEYLMDIGGNSLKMLIESGEMKPSSNEMRSVVSQVLKIIKIVGDGGYIIDDLHSGNIVVKNGICKLIDYGEIKKLNKEVEKTVNNTKYLYDLSSLLSMISGTNDMFINMPPPVDDHAPGILDHIKFLKENNAWNNIYKYIRIMNPKCIDVDQITSKPVITEDEIGMVASSVGPYLATLNLVLYPELNRKYWNIAHPEHTLKYNMYVEEDSLLFFIKNFNNIDSLIDHFSHNSTMVFSVGEKFYDTKQVWGLMKDKPVESVATTDIEYLLNEPQWDDNLSARDVLKDPVAYPEHTARINAADLSFPILVVKNGKGKFILADGMHRLAKAYRDKIPYVNIQHIPKKVLDKTLFDSA